MPALLPACLPPPATDPVAATRARIEKLKLSGTVASEEKEGELPASCPAAGIQSGSSLAQHGPYRCSRFAHLAAADRAVATLLSLSRPAAAADHGKKKLTDVRVNPKIAASLGLKIPVQPPPAAPRAPAAHPAAAAAAAPAAATDIDLLGGLEEPAAPALAPAAPAAAPSFDPFAAPAAPAQQQQQPSWGAFGAPAPAAPAAAPLDLLGGLNSPTPAPAAAQQPRPAAPADPFAALSMPAAPAPPAATAPKPAAAAMAAGVPSALPEDMFSDLTGIGGRAQQPMGHTHGAVPGVGGAGGWGGAPMGAQQSGSFGDFAGGNGFTAAAPAGQPMLPDDFGGFAGTGMQAVPAAQQGAAASSGPDPFADLLK